VSGIGQRLGKLVRGVGGVFGWARRGLGGHPRMLLATLGVIVIVLAVAISFLFVQVRHHGKIVEARETGIHVARQQATWLLSYDYRTVDRDLERARAALTGEFSDEYARLARNVVAPAAKQQQITTKAEVVGSAVVSADPRRVVALLFINQTTTSQAQEAPRLAGSRVRMELVKRDDRWLVSGLTPL
jgi:Mce-associated membrane protein